MEEKKDKKIEFPSLFAHHYKLITFTAVALMGVIGYGILVSKYQQLWLEGGSNLQILSQEIETKQAYLDDLQRLVNNYKSINQSDIEKIDKILPTFTDVAGLLVQLQDLAYQSGFALASVNISEQSQQQELSKVSKVVKLATNDIQVEDDGRVKKLSVGVNLVGGDYSNLKKFLELTELNLRLFDVNAVYFDPDVDKYSVTFFTYYIVN